MAMSKQQEADFRRLTESVQNLREGLMEALRRIANLEAMALEAAGNKKRKADGKET